MANAASISFRGMFIRESHMSNPEGADRTVTLQCTSDLSDQVSAKMDWGAIDESVTQASLKGKLLALTLSLTPADKLLKKYALDLSIKSVSEFKLVGIRDKEGNTLRRELRFKIETGAANASEMVEKYCARMARNGGLCKVSYEKQDNLFESPEAEGEDEQQELG